MDLSEFCGILSKINGLDSTQKAISILWWHDKNDPGIEMTGSELNKAIKKYSLANPNSTFLSKRLTKSPYTLRGKKKSYFRLKASEKETVLAWFKEMLDGNICVDIDSKFLPIEIWKNSRGYIEKVCTQLNGCYQFGFFDGASVMARRLIETLIIECYEFLKRGTDIKNSNDHYLMLDGLINQTVGKNGLNVGRESKKFLKEIKAIGDRAAHNLRYNARKPDLDEIRTNLRVVIEELINIGSIQKKN